MESINLKTMMEALEELSEVATVDPEGVAAAMGFDPPEDVLKVAGMLAYTEQFSPAGAGPAIVVGILLGFVLGEDLLDLNSLPAKVELWRKEHPEAIDPPLAI